MSGRKLVPALVSETAHFNQDEDIDPTTSA